MSRCLDEVLTRLEAAVPDLRYVSAEEAGRLAEEGKVSVTVGADEPGEIRAATGARHAWLWLRGLYVSRPKARLYAQGLGVLIVLVILTGAARLAGRRRRRTA